MSMEVVRRVGLARWAKLDLLCVLRDSFIVCGRLSQQQTHWVHLDWGSCSPPGSYTRHEYTGASFLPDAVVSSLMSDNLDESLKRVGQKLDWSEKESNEPNLCKKRQAKETSEEQLHELGKEIIRHKELSFRSNAGLPRMEQTRIDGLP